MPSAASSSLGRAAVHQVHSELEVVAALAGDFGVNHGKWGPAGFLSLLRGSLGDARVRNLNERVSKEKTRISPSPWE